MEELRKLFECETGKTFHVYDKNKDGRQLVRDDACSIFYAVWLEKKFVLANTNYTESPPSCPYWYKGGRCLNSGKECCGCLYFK